MARGAFTSGIRAAGEVLKLFGREEQAQVEATEVKSSIDQAAQSATHLVVCESTQLTSTQPTQDVLTRTPHIQPNQANQPNMPNMMMPAQPWAAWMPGMPGMPYYMAMPYPANMAMPNMPMPMSTPTMMPVHAPAMMPGVSMPYYPPMMMYPYFHPTFNPSA